MSALLEVRGLRLAHGKLDVVRGVDLDVPAGPYGVGLIGESGSGKTTIARAILGLHPVGAGEIRFRGSSMHTVRRAELRRQRTEVQLVFQDGDGALDPRMSVLASIREPWMVHRTHRRGEHRAHAAQLLDEVGLEAELLDRYPHQLSGGQRQRVVIARALALSPSLLVLDEPTSALDVTVQERILRLVEGLRESRGLAYLLISHNLAVVSRLCESSAVLYRGEIVERGATATLLSQPRHPYTQALRAAVPELGVVRPPVTKLAGGVPPGPPGVGCAYASRCPLAVDRCRIEQPLLRKVDGREVACHRADDPAARLPGRAASD